MRGQVVSRQQPVDPVAGYKAARAQIREKQERVRQQFNAMSDEEQAANRAKMQEEIDDLDEEIEDLRSRRRAPPNQGQMGVQVQEAIIRAKHQDVLGNEEGQARARSNFIRMVGVDRKPKNLATFEEAVQAAREEMGGPVRTSAEKARFGGISAKGNGAAARKRPTEIRMGPHERAMAREAYSHLSEEQAFKRWAKDMADRMPGD